jgi:hypothetical protein
MLNCAAKDDIHSKMEKTRDVREFVRAATVRECGRLAPP